MPGSESTNLKKALEKERSIKSSTRSEISAQIQQRRKRIMKASAAVLCTVAAASCITAIVLIGDVTNQGPTGTNAPTATPTWNNNTGDGFAAFDGVATVTSNYNILQVLDHDPTAFTQGLYYHNDLLVESTGLYGQSLVRIWDPQTGQVIRETPVLDDAYFGEGLTWYRDANGNELYIQLTWQEQTAFLYTTELTMIDSFKYQTTTMDGWGITFDPVEEVFYVSDGSAYIHVWNLNFQETDKFRVTRQNSVDGPAFDINDLNELEWDPTDGTILANVWRENIVVRILPETGQIVKVYDFGALESGGGNVLNGIAFHSNNTWWITGKRWRNLYLIEFLDA